MTDDDHKILQGHVPKSKLKHVPKVLELGPLIAVGYVKVILPELIWLALLNETLGLMRAAEIGVAAATPLLPENKECPGPWIAAASVLGNLDEDQRQLLVDRLSLAGFVEEVDRALAPLVSLYPEFPGAFLCKKRLDQPEALAVMKSLVEKLFDLESTETVFMCALAFYIADQVRKVSQPGETLMRFPEIQDYPHTKISVEIASLVRGQVLFMIGTDVQEPGFMTWSSYFWNRGLEIEPVDWSIMRS